VIEHLNAWKTLVSQLVYIDIKTEKEDKCITLLCSLLDSWDNLVAVIGSTTQVALKFEEVVTSLVLEEMGRKSIDGVAKDDLSIRGWSLLPLILA
jgi:hypothetical protein